MLQLKPDPQNLFICPACGVAAPVINGFHVESIHILADCTCTDCQLEFYQVYPVGHNVDYRFSMGKRNGKSYGQDESHEWLSNAIVKAHREKQKRHVEIEKIVFKACDQVVILNTLDSLYGHVLLKLYNAFHHLDDQKETGLVLIIPRIFKWLIPAGCAEVWIVDLKLSELVYGYDAIEKFVAAQCTRFNKVYLSKAYSHPDFSQVNIARLTGIEPFNLENFSSVTPTITFVLREDRWWFDNVSDYWFYRVCRKLSMLAWGSRLLSLRQNALVKRTIDLIKKEIPHAVINVVGLGRTGNFGKHVRDERQWKVNDDVEKAWCTMYSQSHVVIGVHGSNMLLPTAHAAGCVEILPQDRYGNMVQDLSVRYNDRLQLFLYRFADQFAAAGSVADKAIAMIRDYEFYHRNMSKNVHSDGRPGAGVHISS